MLQFINSGAPRSQVPFPSNSAFECFRSEEKGRIEAAFQFVFCVKVFCRDFCVSFAAGRTEERAEAACIVVCLSFSSAVRSFIEIVLSPSTNRRSINLIFPVVIVPVLSTQRMFVLASVSILESFWIKEWCLLIATTPAAMETEVKSINPSGIMPIITDTVFTAAEGRSVVEPTKKVLAKRRIPAGSMIKLRNFKR